MGRVERSRELARKRKRKATLQRLRKEYASATDRATKELIQAKARRVSPFVVLGEPESE